MRRYKRFLADVELADGRCVTAHCPNTGAMTGCAEPGSRVWLSHSESRTRKYPFTWELVETAAGVACIHSARANRVVREALQGRTLPGFDAWPEIRSEVSVGDGSRVDLLLEGAGGRVFIEVKSVTLCQGEGCGAFPDAVSLRARRHLQTLRSLADAGNRALLIFCVMHTGIESVSPARDIDPAYRDALAEAIEGGVEVQAWATAISPTSLVLTHPLPFALDPPGPGAQPRDCIGLPA